MFPQEAGPNGGRLGPYAPERQSLLSPVGEGAEYDALGSRSAAVSLRLTGAAATQCG